MVKDRNEGLTYQLLNWLFNRDHHKKCCKKLSQVCDDYEQDKKETGSLLSRRYEALENEKLLTEMKYNELLKQNHKLINDSEYHQSAKKKQFKSNQKHRDREEKNKSKGPIQNLCVIL